MNKVKRQQSARHINTNGSVKSKSKLKAKRSSSSKSSKRIKSKKVDDSKNELEMTKNQESDQVNLILNKEVRDSVESPDKVYQEIIDEVDVGMQLESVKGSVNQQQEVNAKAKSEFQVDNGEELIESDQI